MSIAEAFQKIWSKFRKNKIVESVHIKPVARDEGGVELIINDSILGEGGGVSDSSDSSATSYPCKVTGAPTAGVYPVDVYKDGKTETKTGTGNIQVLQLHISSVIPTGTWLMGFDTTLVNYNDEE